MTEFLTALSLYFSTSCERYLVVPDPQSLESVSDVDLEQARLVTRARIYLYGHPLDHVLLRLIEHEQVSRSITR